MVFKCKKCGMQIDEEKRFEIHKGVHGRKSRSRLVEYEDPEFSKDKLRG